MTKYVPLALILLLIVGSASFAFACHPDKHVGIVVAINRDSQTFMIVHDGNDPEMGGKLFTFSAEESLLRELKIGMRASVKFVEERDRLMAKEVLL